MRRLCGVPQCAFLALHYVESTTRQVGLFCCSAHVDLACESVRPHWWSPVTVTLISAVAPYAVGTGDPNVMARSISAAA